MNESSVEPVERPEGPELPRRGHRREPSGQPARVGSAGPTSLHIDDSTISGSAMAIGPDSHAEVRQAWDRLESSKPQLHGEQCDLLVDVIDHLLLELSKTSRSGDGQDLDEVRAELSATRQEAADQGTVAADRARQAVRAAMATLGRVADLAQVTSTARDILGDF